MKAFGIAFILWSGTISVLSGILFIAAIFLIDLRAAGIAFASLFGAIVFGCPLLLPTTLLIELARKIPYSATVRLYWLGFMILLQNYLYLELLMFAGGIESVGDELRSIFAISVPCLVIVLYLRKNALKNFFSQTTNNAS